MGNESSGISHDWILTQTRLPKDLVVFRKESPVGLEVSAGRGEDLGALEALETMEEHRSVLLSEGACEKRRVTESARGLVHRSKFASCDTPRRWRGSESGTRSLRHR